MFIIKTEQSFDSAHFLAGYDGKCRNIHGHRWRILVEVCSEELEAEGHLRGMVMDFGTVKQELKAIADSFDHTFIIERGTLKETTIAALESEGFKLTEVGFRPTAENFAKFFFDTLSEKGYVIMRTEVYETPGNSAVYCGGN